MLVGALFEFRAFMHNVLLSIFIAPRPQRNVDLHQECQIDCERLHVTVETTKHRPNLPALALCTRALSGYLPFAVEADVALYLLALIYRFKFMIIHQKRF